MIRYIQAIFHHPRYYILQNLLLISLIAILFHMYKNRYEQEYAAANIEGFTQQQPFVLKRDQEVYDDVYADMYDTLTHSVTRGKWEIDQMLALTNSDEAQRGVFLDVGSANGVKVDELNKRGYTAYGVEKSDDMIKLSNTRFPDAVIKRGDVSDPMLFDRSTFSHVLCVNFTLYEFEDKVHFFNNCYFWMKPNSYLVLHLVEPKKFNPVVTVGKNKWVPEKKNTNKRVTDTLVDFFDFMYHAKYDFPVDDTDKRVIFTETITDKKTKNIRQNERTLFMDDITDILQLAHRLGFVVHGKTDMREFNGDEHQYLYVLRRTL